MIAYLHAETVKRSAGRSIVASSAYISGEKETNEYTGLTHDYRSKSGIVHSEVLLPPNAPQSFYSAEKLWSSLECVEKSPQAKLGLSIVAAIPTEIPKEQWIPLAKEFCQNFVGHGCCVQFAIHNPIARDDRGVPINAQGFPAKSPEEYQYLNPHIHCLVCQRMIDENGKWLSRTSCQYIVQDMHSGDVRSMTAQELKKAEPQWQKQYQYNTGAQLQWMTKQEASCMGYERVSRTPRMTRHGTSTPESASVGSPQFLHDMRLHWQESVNNFLSQYAPDITERIDMRSYKEQGLDKVPQLHLGPSAAKEERKHSRLTAEGKEIAENVSGYLVSLNREIRRHNHMVDFYAAQEREAMQIEQEAERQAALLEVYRRQWISARCYDISLTKQLQQLTSDTEQLQERLGAFQAESSKINSNLMRIRSENADLSAKMENTRHRNDRRQMEQKIQKNEQLLQQGEQLLQQLRVRYGYEDEAKLQKDQLLLRQALSKISKKEKLLHAAKQQVSESKERYLKQKALVPVRIKHLVASYQTRYRQEHSASQLASTIGEAVQLVLQVEQTILHEEEQVEWQERQQ